MEGGSGGGDSEVQRTMLELLNQLDGFEPAQNIKVVMATNRIDILDPALLRPGRLEVHVEIPLPDKEGRREILQLQFKELRRRGRLSKPLCDALDGHARNEHSFRRRRSWLFRSRHAQEVECSNILDLAADRWTSGFSGADLAGLVRCAGSLSLDRCRRQGEGNLDDLIITLEDVHRALVEVTS
jgi:ATP-dependent 26S proteasome regulatory subunit